MKAKGIRILDKKNNIVSVELPDILKEIPNGKSFYWSVLYLYATGHLGENQSMPALEKKIIESEKGLFITWENLNDLSHKFYDLMHIIIIGCKKNDLLKRYENNQKMYEHCNIVIEMFDSCYWEIFSKDHCFIDRLEGKFKKTEILSPDWMET